MSNFQFDIIELLVEQLIRLDVTLDVSCSSFLFSTWHLIGGKGISLFGYDDNLQYFDKKSRLKELYGIISLNTNFAILN